jgi:hypothetical protein
MERNSLLFASLVCGIALSASGCRSCSSCHDYSPPVADCECNASGTLRAGSAGGGQVTSGYVEGEQVMGEYETGTM